MQTLPPDATRPRHRGGLQRRLAGGGVTPLIVTPVYLWWGWRGAFWFTGVDRGGVAGDVGGGFAAPGDSRAAASPAAG